MDRHTNENQYIMRMIHFILFENMQKKLFRKNVMNITILKTPLSIILVSVLTIGAGSTQASDDVVNIYSARKEALILPLLERFEKETGIGFNLVTGKADGLLKRLEIEGHLSPADLFITVDAGRLQRAKDAKVLQAIENPVLEKRIPKHLRDEDKFWFGLSQRSRTLVYAKERVKPEEMSTYENLADPKWKGRICVRSSGNIYNQSLVVSMIAANGEEKTQVWAKKLVENFARKPTGGDTDQLKAVSAGLCDVALVNTYYFARMVNSTDEKTRKIAEKLAIFWPNQAEDQRGVHMNVSGAGITRHAKHIKSAQHLLEFLVTDASQAWYAEVNNEYPVVSSASIAKTLTSFGDFKPDTLNLTLLGKNNPKAVKLMDRAGWR